MNQIANLQHNLFTSCSLQRQIEIKNLGRPLPDLTIEKKQLNKDKTDRIRKFNRGIYMKNDWICGCDVKHALFCFPCVLFGGDIWWTKSGVTDLAHIWPKMKTHENSKLHMNNVFRFALLGKPNIQTQLDSTYRQALVAHNEQVDKNRYVLNLIINCIRFCDALELPLRSEDDKGESSNSRLINLSSQLDRDLKEHFSKSTFKDASTIIQDELLQCMLNVYHEEVTKEIENTDYVAVIADETTDVASQFQLVIILRYIIGNQPVERFWNFVSPQGQDPLSVSNCILKQIDPLLKASKNKLIAQSYDGAAIMRGGLNGVQKIIKEKYNGANFIHYYSHEVNLVVMNAASINKQARIFFAHLTGLVSFLSNFPERIKLLEEVVLQRGSFSPVSGWNFNTGGVNIVFKYRKHIIEVLEILAKSDDIRLQSTIAQADSYRLCLQNGEFVFWLTVFHKVMPLAENIFNEFQKKNIGTFKTKQELLDFENSIYRVFNEMDVTLAEVNDEGENNHHGNMHHITENRHEEESFNPKRPRMSANRIDEINTEIKVEQEEIFCSSETPILLPAQIDEIKTDIEITEMDIQEKEIISHSESPRLSSNHGCKKIEALQVCNAIIQQIRARFDFTGHLAVANLFSVQKFPIFKNTFPDSILNDVLSAYPSLEKNRLKAELQVLYNRNELRVVSGAVPLLSLIFENDLSNIFRETLKLLKVLVTMPMITSETERCFSTLKTIKAFLRNTIQEEKFSALGMLSVEKAYVNNITDFNKKVIDLFAKNKDHGIDLDYKKLY